MRLQITRLPPDDLLGFALVRGNPPEQLNLWDFEGNIHETMNFEQNNSVILTSPFKGKVLRFHAHHLVFRFECIFITYLDELP